MEDIIQKLIQKKIKVIFFTPPYHISYTKEFPKEDVQELKMIMEELVRKYKIYYYNFSNDSTISFDETFFSNADHLNEAGNIKFTKIINSLSEDH